MFSARCNDKNPSAGFYESFSDVIFATMAIFILLMTVFMVIIKAGTTPQASSLVAAPSLQLQAANMQAAKIKQQFEEEAILQRRKDVSQRKRDELQAMLSGLEYQLESTERSLEAMQASTAEARKQTNSITIKERVVEIVVVLDASNSMKDEIRELRNVVSRIAQLLPYVTREFRIGIIAHAHAQSPSTIESFPMMTVRRASEDGGRSYRRVVSWLDTIRTRGGATKILEASEIAATWFRAPKADNHQIIMVIGDVGPTEQGNGVHPQAEQRISRLKQILTKFSLSHGDRKVIMQFSGRDNLTRSGGSKYDQAKALFQEVVEMAGASGIYSENPTTMFVDFLVAALEQK